MFIRIINYPKWLDKIKIVYWNLPFTATISGAKYDQKWKKDIDFFKANNIDTSEVLCGIHGFPVMTGHDWPINPDGSLNIKFRWINGVDMSLQDIDSLVEYATEREFNLIFLFSITQGHSPFTTAYGQAGDDYLYHDSDGERKVACYCDLSKVNVETQEVTDTPVYITSINSIDYRNHIKKNIELVCMRYRVNKYFKGICIEEPWLWDGPIGHPMWDIDSFDYTPNRKGPMVFNGINFLKEVRSMIKSIRKDLILITNGCGASGFSFWSDGESGDSEPPIGCLGYLREQTVYALDVETFFKT